MTRQWTHVHSVAVGAIVGVSATQHGWLIFGAGVLVGASVVYAIRYGRRAARVTGQAGLTVGHLLAARVETEHERARGIRAASRLKVEKARALRAEVEKKTRSAYVQGRIDEGSH